MPAVAPSTDTSAHATQPAAERRGLRAVPAVVWLVTALWGALLVGASLLWPMTYGYDEPQHIDMAYVYSGDPVHFDGPGQLLPTVASVHLQARQPGYPPHQSLAAAPIGARPGRPSLTDLGGRAETHGTQPNQMVQHPPVYYWLGAAVLRLPGVSHLAWDVQVWLLRLLSVLLVLPVPLLCWAGAKRLLSAAGAAPEPAVVAAVVPLTIPNLIRDASSVNNDSLLILATSVLLYALIRVVTGDLGTRTALVVAASLCVALLSKGFALVLPPVVLLAYLVGAGGGLGARLRALVRPVGIAAIGGVVGGLWWLRNLVDYGTVQVSGFGSYEKVLYGPADNHGTVRMFLRPFVTQFVRRIWGGIGLADDPSPGRLIIYGWLAVVALALVAGFVRARRGEISRALVLLTPLVLTAAIVAYGSLHQFERWSNVVRGAQGRYLYHLVVVIAALVAVGFAHVVPARAGRLLVPVLLAAAVVTNAVAWRALLNGWYGGQFSGLLRWSPVPVGVTIAAVVVVPVAASLLALAGAVGSTRRRAAVSAEAQPG